MEIKGSLLVDRDRGRGGSASRAATEESLFTETDGNLRLRVDMANLWLAGVAQLHRQRIVGIGKHVCGAATDLALRCLVPAQPSKPEGPGPGSEVDTIGIVIALCCYHTCSWEAYCNQEWVCQQGLGAADFGQLVRMAGWCHIEASSDSARARTRVARLCKQFIDAGRALYLFHRGFDVRVEPFVDANVTKENKCLTARMRGRASEATC